MWEDDLPSGSASNTPHLIQSLGPPCGGEHRLIRVVDSDANLPYESDFPSLCRENCCLDECLQLCGHGCVSHALVKVLQPSPKAFLQ